MKTSLGNRLKNPHPLSGLKIWVTRAKSGEKPGKLCQLLEEFGAETIHAPVVEIVGLDELPDLRTSLDREIEQLEQYATIVFVSSTGVNFFLRRVQELLGGLNSLSQKQIVAIGPGTADQLTNAGLESQQPRSANSKSLGGLLVHEDIKAPLLIVRADRGSRELRDILSNAGRRFEEVVAYAIRDQTEPEAEVLAALDGGHLNWAVATSASIAAATMDLYGRHLKSIKIMCISNAVADVFREHGMQNVLVANEPNFVGIRDSLLDNVAGS